MAYHLRVKAGSFDPLYWTVTNPDTGAPVDLTAPGYSVTGVVATTPDGDGQVLVTLADGVVWRRTATGRIYFEPPATVSSAWTFTAGYWQAELAHPSGQPIRFDEGRFTVSPELVL